MNVPTWVWLATAAVFVGIVVVDLLVVDSRPHVFGVREATRWVLVYIALALSFAVGMWIFAGGNFAAQFLAGYITEYSLSVDNLFVFVVIMSSFAVPQQHQHRVLLIGVVIALLLRTVLIFVGAAALDRFAGTFYLFGAVLLFTAVKLLRHHDDAPEPGDNVLVRRLERVVPTTREYHGTKLTLRVNGQRVVTPMLMVMVAIGTTDLLFALDSIPAIFGLTREPYIVLTANAFALMGLRQLYFLLNGLLDRLIYLSYGLALILGFIGVKLIFHAMHETHTLWADAPDIGTGTSLVIILSLLLVTTAASLRAVHVDPNLRMRRALGAQREALKHQGEELLLLHAEVGAAQSALDVARSSGAPSDHLDQAEQRMSDAERARREAANRLAALADEAHTDELPALPSLPALPELTALSRRAPQVFDAATARDAGRSSAVSPGGSEMSVTGSPATRLGGGETGGPGASPPAGPADSAPTPRPQDAGPLPDAPVERHGDEPSSGDGSQK